MSSLSSPVEKVPASFKHWHYSCCFEGMDQTIENHYSRIDVDENRDGLGAFALFLERKEADLAVSALQRNGFAGEDISLLAPQRSGTHDFVYHQPQSLLRGALIGGVVGLFLAGFLGFLFSSRQVITSGAFDPLHAQSPLLTAVVFALIGTVTGVAFGLLAGIGSTKSAAKRYGFYLKEGGIVLVVHLKNAEERSLAERVLDKTKGQDISVLEESKIWSTIIPEKNRLVFH